MQVCAGTAVGKWTARGCAWGVYLDDEDEVETRQDGGLQVDVLRRRLHVVVAARRRVGGGHHGRARVEHRGDARLGDGDGLLLHRLVDCHAILRSHLVELVDAHHTAVCQHHRAPLQVRLRDKTHRSETSGATKTPVGCCVPSLGDSLCSLGTGSLFWGHFWGYSPEHLTAAAVERMVARAHGG